MECQEVKQKLAEIFGDIKFNKNFEEYVSISV